MFVYLHVEIKVHTRKSANTIEFAGNSSRVNLLIRAHLLADNFIDGITAGKIKT